MLLRRKSMSRRALAQASAWLARLHADDRTDDDVERFRAWLSADPVHGLAFERVHVGWDAIGGLGLPNPAPVAAPPRVSRRVLLTGLGAASATGASLLGWQYAAAGVYRTKIGEQQRIAFEPGSYILMDTDTRLRVRGREGESVVTLYRGRSHVSVSSRRAEPLVLVTDDRRVTLAPGTRCDVECDDDHRSIFVLDGEARVAPADRKAAAAVLRAGERLVAAAPSQADAPALDHIDRPDPAPSLAWPAGRAVFSDVALSEAVREMNRYSRIKLTIEDESLASRRISGMYRFGDTAAFARSVALMLRADVRLDDDVVVLASKSRAAKLTRPVIKSS